jgi:hypothetical protein
MTTILAAGEKVLIRSGAVAAVQSCCCGGSGPCPCTKGSLPDAVKVSFTGSQGNKMKSDSLLSLTFSSKCFGEGGSGTAEAPGGDKVIDGKTVINGNTGAISSVNVTDGGKGYAKYGREEPTLAISNKSDVAATTEITLSKTTDGCKLDYWSISSISVTDGGRGYTPDQTLSISLGAGDSVQAAAAGVIKTKRIEPSLTASPENGSSENLTVSVSKTTADPPTWKVSSVAVDKSLGGYVEGQSVKFSGDGVTEAAAAEAYIRTSRSEPSISLSVGSTGSGAVLTPTLSKVNTSPFEGATPVALYAWSVDSISINDAGSGYSRGDPISAVIDDGQAIDNKIPWTGGGPYYGEVNEVDESGAITKLSTISTGFYFKADDVAVRVDVWQGGEYYTGGVLDSVSLADGGKYYHENPSLSPYVADVDVAVHQGFPGGGTMGSTKITATVEDDPESENFGEVKSLSISDGGQDWLGWYWVYGCDCSWIYGKGEGADYSVACYRDWDANGDPTCSYTGFRCYEGDACSYGPLLQLRATSPIKTEIVGHATAPCGIPGKHGGPISGVSEISSSGWAIPGRVVVTPDRLSPGDFAVTCTMAEKTFAGYATYWEVESASVSGSADGLYDGQQVTFYFSGSAEDDAGLPGGGSFDPGRENARGTVNIDESGNFIDIVVTHPGVYYQQKHSSEASAIAPAVTVSIIQHKPSKGSGATFTTTIEDDTSSPQFGHISLSVDAGGDNYLSYTSSPFSTGHEGSVVVTYFGPNEYPTVLAQCGGPQESIPAGSTAQGTVTYTADTKITNCGDFSFDAHNGDSGVKVAANDGAAFIGSHKCCSGCYVKCDDEPSQVAIHMSRGSSSGSSAKAATHDWDTDLIIAPTMTTWVANSGGCKASLTSNIAEILPTPDNDPARRRWKVTSVAIQDGGTGYSIGDSVVAESNNYSNIIATISVASVSADGAITSVRIDDPGSYYEVSISEDNACSFTCNADEVEMVFDLVEIMDSGNCGVSISRSIGTTPASRDDCPKFAAAETNATNSPQVGETNSASVTCAIFSSDTGTTSRMEITVSQSWSGVAESSVNVGSGFTELYKSNDVKAKCSGYESWDLKETKNRRSENCKAPFAVGDRYWRWQQAILPPLQWASYSRYRVCLDYEVSIEFQK